MGEERERDGEREVGVREREGGGREVGVRESELFTYNFIVIIRTVLFI